MLLKKLLGSVKNKHHLIPIIIRHSYYSSKMTNTFEDRIKEQGDVVRKLKAEKAAKEVIQEEVAKLKALKLGVRSWS